MSSFQKVLIAVGLLCAAAQAVKVQTFSKDYFEPNDEYKWFELSKTVDQHLMYLLCTESSVVRSWGLRTVTEGYRKEMNCCLKLKMVNGTEKRCDMKLPLPQDCDFKIINYLESMLGGKKAVFQWTWLDRREFFPRLHHSVSLVDMNNCRSNTTALTFESEETNVLVYDDSFHVIKRDILMSNGSQSFWILRYDPEGQQVGGPVIFLLKPYDHMILMVADRFNSKSGIFLFTLTALATVGVEVKICHVSHEGFQTVLFTSSTGSSVLYMSNDHGYYLFCKDTFEEKLNISCIQSDVKGQKKLSTTVLLEKRDRIFGIFNQRQGGIIIMYYFDCRDPSYDCKDAPVKVKMVDVEGKVTRNIELTGVKMDHFSSSLTWPKARPSINHLETDTEHCFYFAVLEPRGKNINFKHFNKCFDKLVKNEEKERK